MLDRIGTGLGTELGLMTGAGVCSLYPYLISSVYRVETAVANSC